MMNDNSSSIPPVTVPDFFTPPVKHNRWVVCGEDVFALWRLEIPDEMPREERWGLMKKVLQFGQEEEVYRVVESENRVESLGITTEYSEVSSSCSYIEHVEQVFKNHHILIVPTALRLSNAVSRVSYYDIEGSIIESEVGYDLVRRLLVSLGEDPDEPFGEDYFLFRDFFSISDPHCPVELSEEREPTGRVDLCLEIRLYSDIWFPRVWDYSNGMTRVQLDEDGHPIWAEGGLSYAFQPRWQDPTGWFDNSELALRHTPRLNRFLQRVKQLALEYGVTWTIDREECRTTLEDSERLWDENGIFLDFE